MSLKSNSTKHRPTIRLITKTIHIFTPRDAGVLPKLNSIKYSDVFSIYIHTVYVIHPFD